jgi:hypothetical protein
MRAKDKFYAFAFKGLLAEQALDQTDRSSRKIHSEKEFQELGERVGLSFLDEELVSKARRMAVVYTAINAFENYVRAFVSKKLFEEKGKDWWLTDVPEKIRRSAESRKASEGNVRWHTPRGEEPINFTEFSDLVSVMAQNFELFEPHIHTIEWARNIIHSLERSRNVIMHSGELGAQDIERVGMNIRDWVRQVG